MNDRETTLPRKPIWGRGRFSEEADPNGPSVMGFLTPRTRKQRKTKDEHESLGEGELPPTMFSS